MTRNPADELRDVASRWAAHAGLEVDEAGFNELARRMAEPVAVVLVHPIGPDYGPNLGFVEKAIAAVMAEVANHPKEAR